MKREEFLDLERYRMQCEEDGAHDREHVYRVLYTALEIAAGEPGVSLDVLIAACLLHDIGRAAQQRNPALCHAAEGAAAAYGHLLRRGWPEKDAAHVRDCIASHRYRGGNPPATIEAKILFDADKIDAAGAVGIARTLLYSGAHNRPLYLTAEDGSLLTSPEDRHADSFLREYHSKLKHIYGSFYTARAAEIAKERQGAAEDFAAALQREVSAYRRSGQERLRDALTAAD